ncbi:hypothetical protein [Pseudoalteromonas luteoviolacea]|uniref:Uncharacterized protein n=1 Tax=Pseudoalteromonas luteoviolacea S4060-1 TaxID=1365257 RepID=A0A167N8Y0_9GAMM|nr:hypothetical protein [Pseudoalteromonas luteoviolacea]KZN67701.1 hypothetical protein N478_02775 [Pseudoalteromonas luteoviolacea S4060-1]
MKNTLTLVRILPVSLLAFAFTNDALAASCTLKQSGDNSWYECDGKKITQTATRNRQSSDNLLEFQLLGSTAVWKYVQADNPSWAGSATTSDTAYYSYCLLDDSLNRITQLARHSFFGRKETIKNFRLNGNNASWRYVETIGSRTVGSDHNATIPDCQSTPPQILNLSYPEGRVGQTQRFSFDYRNATSCWNQSGTRYFTSSTPKNGTFSWTSPVRTQVSGPWQTIVSCTNATGVIVQDSVTTRVNN